MMAIHGYRFISLTLKDIWEDEDSIVSIEGVEVFRRSSGIHGAN